MSETPERKTLINRLLFNTISNYVGRLVGVVTWFLLTPFILYRLDASLYGLWVLVGSVVAYGSLLDFGIAGAVTKYVAEYHAKGQIHEAKSFVATALALYFVLGFIVLFISIAVAPVFPQLFEVPDEHKQTAVLLVILSGASMGLAIPSASTTAVLRGFQRFDLMNLLGIITQVGTAVAIIIVLLLGGSVIELVLTITIVNLLMQIPAIWLIYRIAPQLQFGLARPGRKMLRTVTSFSSSLFLIQMGGQLESKTDEIVIGAFLPVSAVTPYHLARRLSTIPQMIADQFLSLLLPLASELHAGNDQARLRSLYIVSTRITVGVFLATGISLTILAGPILTIWVGEEFAVYAYLVIILVLASFIDTSQWPAGFILQGIARHRYLAILTICSGIANLTISLVLVRQFGLVGVALGTLIPTTIINLLLVLPYSLRIIGVPFIHLVNRIIMPTFVPIVPTSMIVFVLRELLQPMTFLPTVLIAAAGSCTYIVFYLRMKSSEFERNLFREIVAKTLGQLRRIYTNPT
jgi:O-antigen/teichoic acid export membrane protein